ncbi:MAG: magnesium/cobalt transporter CorA [Phycisphaerales bacterium]|nr:magnesium/cobalt transporter CorA [Phycisphaerales bacterium]
MDAAPLQPTIVNVFGFGPTGCHEEKIDDPARIAVLRDAWPLIWVDVEGLADSSKLKSIAEMFGLHALAMEDVINRHQRAKLEEYEDHDFIIARMASSTDSAQTEQIGIFLGKNFVVTFQEGHPGDSLQEVRARLRQNRGVARIAGADHLAYSILDAIIDAFFPLLESYGDQLENIEDEILRRPTASAVSELHQVKRELLTLRRTMWSQREVVHSMLRETSPFVSNEARVFLRDVYDHSVRIIELVETFRELASDLMELYLSSVSNRLNDVMRVLTVISTIFIPLTFIVGVYGMNFDTDVSAWNMPELHWPFGYVGVWIVMLAIAGGLTLYFRRKGWLHSTVVAPPPRENDE